jgi:hypothetical protein
VTTRKQDRIDDSGLIECTIPQGEHTISIRYELTQFHKIGYFLSLVGVLFFIWLIIQNFLSSFRHSTKSNSWSRKI